MQGGDLAVTLPPALPNITGRVSVSNAWFGSDQGALYRSGSGEGCGDKAANGIGVWIDASRSNKIYGTGDTVQMPALQLIPQVKY